MIRRALFLALALLLLVKGQQKISPELERTEQMIEQLSQLKAKVSSIEAQLDAMLTALAEQRGALANPKTYNALEHVEEQTEPDVRKPASRCSALTSKGGRCTRPAVSGSRYCKQHQMAHAK